MVPTSVPPTYGPTSCVGRRFPLMVWKSVIVYLLVFASFTGPWSGLVQSKDLVFSAGTMCHDVVRYEVVGAEKTRERNAGAGKARGVRVFGTIAAKKLSGWGTNDGPWAFRERCPWANHRSHAQLPRAA